MTGASQTTVDTPPGNSPSPGQIAHDAGAPAIVHPSSLIPHPLTRLWAARGFFGGLAAAGLAILAQMAILRNEDDVAGRYYLAAFALLVVSLSYPSLPRIPARVRRPGSPAAAAAAAAAAAPSTNLSTSQALTPAASPASSTLSVRRVRGQSPIGVRASFPARYAAMRARLGLRATVAGLAITFVLAGASAWLLLRDVANPFGGWLWAASLLALLATFVGAEGWPQGNGLLPTPHSDFFARGLPTLNARRHGLAIGGLLLVALILRLYNLEVHPGIFGDEGERALEAVAINEGETPEIFGYGWWGVPNLYFYLMAPMLALFGDTMVGARMLSVVSSLLTVWFIYKIGCLLWGVRAGLIAAALLAVSPLALQYSRQAGESTPTSALWAGGYYFLFVALRYRRWSDWTLAGLLWGFSLYFYAAGKLIVPLAALVALYCLVRWRLAFFKRYALGFALLGLAMGLTFMPQAIFSQTENWLSFMGRAGETSIFSPPNRGQAFGRYGLQYDPAWARESTAETVLAHPVEWARLVYAQLSVTFDVLYKSEDPTAFYQIREHKGSMLSPLWAALALLGIAYGLWKLLDARFGIVDVWFWGGLLGAALTMDTPSVQRIVGAWPPLMLFPAALLDRVFAAAWPLDLSFARRWAAVPLAGLLAFFGADGSREYFDHYVSLCPFCASTSQARYTQGLGDDYHAYMMGIGGYPRYFNYGSTRYIAKGVEGDDLYAPADYFPVTNNDGKGTAFMVFDGNTHYLPVIRLFYPGGVEEQVKGTDGKSYFTSYKVSREQMARSQALKATYAAVRGQGEGVRGQIERIEQNLGTEGDLEWTPPDGLSYPARATWEGGLVAPSYGAYTFRIEGREAKLELDGGTVLESRNGESAQVELVLAKGVHTVRLTALLEEAASRVSAEWGGAGSGPLPVSASYLYTGPTGGLSAEVGPATGPEMVATSDPFAGQPVREHRVYPALGFRESATTFGREPFSVRFRGYLNIQEPGRYTFSTNVNGIALLLIDGKVVSNTGAAVDPQIIPANPIELSSGRHEVDLRTVWSGGTGPIEWTWVPPGGESALVPPTVLTPLERSWTRDEKPDAQPAHIQGKERPAIAITPERVIGSGSDLKDPRGIGVDAQGNVYVGDQGRGRIVVYSSDGEKLREWRSPPADEELPGIRDLDVAGDGTVYLLDAAGRVEVFTSEGERLRTVQTGELGLYSPNGIAAEVGGVLIADTGNNRVARLSFTGERMAVTLFKAESGGGLKQPLDVAMRAGQLYVLDLEKRVVRLSESDLLLDRWPLTGSGESGGSLMAVSPDGSTVYVADPNRKRVAMLDLSMGGVAYYGAKGQFNGPRGIAVGPDGRVYVLDRNGSVQIFPPRMGE